ncbi:nicotinamide riboside kinase 1 [Lepeophtheirus salmonis]|uniref:nicotinamide riboside kinase 1 n=1 Tax=Lepeophtheirus salmonis TaxID=72036 RepID=UPI001AE2232A|nr:nicotinamide riboside kinase 1-like [Lepeophtheirus salmonis]
MVRGILIGISGPTCSGKSSIARSMSETIGKRTRIYSQDDYYYKEDDLRHQKCPQFNNYINWEVKSAFDIRALNDDLKHRSLESFNILEGITIFDDPLTESLCDIRFFIKLEYDLCKERRSRKSYYPFEPDPPGYFDSVVWPYHEEYKGRIIQREGYYLLDGEESISTNVGIILDHLKATTQEAFTEL